MLQECLILITEERVVHELFESGHEDHLSDVFETRLPTNGFWVLGKSASWVGEKQVQFCIARNHWRDEKGNECAAPEMWRVDETKPWLPGVVRLQVDSINGRSSAPMSPSEAPILQSTRTAAA